jgi:hypothetical protein
MWLTLGTTVAVLLCACRVSAALATGRLTPGGLPGLEPSEPPASPPADLCALVGEDRIRALVPYAVTTNDPATNITTLADTKCMARTDHAPVGFDEWTNLDIFLRRAGSGYGKSAEQRATDLLKDACDSLETDYGAPQTISTGGLGNRACGRMAVDPSEPKVVIYLRVVRGADYLEIHYARHPGDERKMPAATLELAGAILGAL